MFRFFPKRLVIRTYFQHSLSAERWFGWRSSFHPWKVSITWQSLLERSPTFLSSNKVENTQAGVHNTSPDRLSPTSRSPWPVAGMSLLNKRWTQLVVNTGLHWESLFVVTASNTANISLQIYNTLNGLFSVQSSVADSGVPQEGRGNSKGGDANLLHGQFVNSFQEDQEHTFNTDYQPKDG